MSCREITACRVCGSTQLKTIIDLGAQCLGGQFPLWEERDPLAYPLRLVRCANGCGLVQLRHTVDPNEMFRSYWYRSGVTETMRHHLWLFGMEAIKLLERVPTAILDIGGNDGSLAEVFHASVEKVVVDPSDVPASGFLNEHISDFYPCKALEGRKFDLIFSVACFYDLDDPVAFARAVHDNLTDDGLWCLEVANLWSMVAVNGYDSICHEHLLYFDPRSIKWIFDRAELNILSMSFNPINGGSMRVYATKRLTPRISLLEANVNMWQFAEGIRRHREALRNYINDLKGARVHLLGASTKANTVLQYCGLDSAVIEAASDRDPRKRGRKTPGTGIPIISEEESRARKPDVYLTVLGHFRDELVTREQEFLKAGGRIAFMLPKVEEVRG